MCEPWSDAALLIYVSQTLVFVTSVSDMFCTAGYNARRQRVLRGKTPDLVVAERLTAKSALAKDKPAGRASSCDITKARLIAENAKEVSQPDNYRAAKGSWHKAWCWCCAGKPPGGAARRGDYESADTTH